MINGFPLVTQCHKISSSEHLTARDHCSMFVDLVGNNYKFIETTRDKVVLVALKFELLGHKKTTHYFYYTSFLL